jgi:carboxymethylenebutenolidase
MKALVITLSSLSLAACATETPEPRIPVNPTAEGALPAAIIGTAAAPRGMDLRYVDGDTATTGYLAVPEGDGPFPSLIIVHEWNGLVDRVRQMADGFAEEGYITLAADLYKGQVGTNPQENVALMTAARENESDVINNLDAAARYLRSRNDVTGKIGAMGWCFGGGIALSYGLGGENHEATAIFYGALVDDPQVLQGMNHEVYGTFARLDGGPAPEHVEAFEAAINTAGIENDLHIYDAVNHGFWLRVDGEPELRTAPATDAWTRLKAYLKRTVG